MKKMSIHEKITREQVPSRLITGKTVCLVFRENEAVSYGYDDDRKMIVIPQRAYEQFIKDEYNEIWR